MIEDGIYQLVMNQPEQLGLEGGFWPYVLPESPTYPIAVFTDVGSESDITFDTAGLQVERWQFDFFAQTFPDVRALYWNFRYLMQGFHGTLPDTDKTWLEDAQHINRVGSYEPATRTYHVMTEFYLKYTLP